MKTKLVYLFIIIFSNYLTINAIGNTPFPQVTPPSSDAAALGKYGQYPVSLYNGLVQIDIPVHTINLPLFSLPISLSYHASGIKVDEIPTPVGLGWVLNAGGVITRTVNGLPDQNFGASGLIHDKQWVLNNYPTNSDDKISYLHSIYLNERNGAADTETDVFYYNFCGFSGSFRYDINGNMIQIPLTNNVIEYVSGQNMFKITGSDGTEYGFLDKETSMCNVNSGWVPYTSSWYLSWIKTTDKRLIDFEYMEDNTSYTEHYPNYWLKMDQIPPDWSGLICETPYVQTSKILLIKTISFPEGSVVFNYSGDRADRRKYRLTGINIKNKSGSSVKAYSLEHSYFTPVGVVTSPQSSGSYSSNYDNRLKLDKLILLDSYNYQVGKYQFYYNVSTLLPAYFNLQVYNPLFPYLYCGQDEWGYYNGVTTNKNLFIYNQEQLYTVPQPQADRSVNQTYAQSCILNKISYPTGGYTEFEYEGNKFISGEDAGGLRIKSVKSYNQQTPNPIVHSYQYENGTGNITGWKRVRGASYTQAEVIPGSSYPCSDEIKFFDYYFSLPNLPLSHTGGSAVFYQKVTEFEGDPANSNGKTEYSFLYSSNDVEYIFPNMSPCVLPYMPNFNMSYLLFIPRFDYMYIDRGWTRGYTKSIKAYKKINGIFSPVKNTVYDYTTFKGQTNVVGFKSFSNFNTQNKIICGTVAFSNADGGYQYTDIIVETGLVKLTQVKDTTFFDGTYLPELTTHFYNNLNNQYEVSSIYRTNSDGSVLKKSFKYPKDMNIAPYTSMVNLNMLSQVIVTIDSIDNKFLQESQTVYSPWAVNSFYAPSSQTLRRGTSAIETNVTYHNYDTYGNPFYISKNGADNVVYLWGYNYQYLIAEIKGVPFSDVTAKVSESSLNTIAAKNEPSPTDWTTINGLRNSLTDALVTTYTYIPLIGMQKMTDPRGVETNYNYDSFGRLTGVTRAGKTVETYEYHYKN